jgi:hypothetical protein
MSEHRLLIGLDVYALIEGVHNLNIASFVFGQRVYPNRTIDDGGEN